MSTLYLVATPIGNLEDITLRALRVLREVPLIAAEDTRHTRKLLNHYEIPTRTISYHEHSGPAGIEAVLGALALGDVALVSDAGTPAISDPGQELVRAALAAGHAVVPVPGPAAVITGLIGSGLPTDQFTYLGFLPRKAAERDALLRSVRAAPQTLVLYEAPHRLRETLSALLAVLGERQACLARELTKVHEEWQRGPLSALLERAAAGEGPRGEYTIIIAGASATAAEPMSEAAIRAALRAELAGGASTRDAADTVAQRASIPRREAYRLALEEANLTPGPAPLLSRGPPPPGAE